MFERYTEKARRVIFFARYEASQFGAPAIEPEHLLLGLMREDKTLTGRFFPRAQITIEAIRREIESRTLLRERIPTSVELPLAPETKRVLHYSHEESDRLQHRHIGTEHLLLGLLREERSMAAQILFERGLRLAAVRDEIARQSGADSRQRKDIPHLLEFSRDLTEDAHNDRLDPLIGRDAEIERLIQILCRRTKNNPVLIGEPGVGKTAIVEGLAQRIVAGEVPSFLENKRILSLDISLIVAGTKYRGQFEERLKQIMRELIDNPQYIVFIDELHTLVGAGSAEGSLDAANILKPALSRGEIQCIGATTPAEFRKSIEKDRSLERRFQAVKVPPPSEDEAIGILGGVRERYESFHQVRYTDEALEAAVRQSTRYIPDRFLPDKAIDVIDEAGARVKLRVRAEQGSLDALMAPLSEWERATYGRAQAPITDDEDEDQIVMGEVTRTDIEEVIARWTGIPIVSLKEEESKKLLRIELELHKRVISQRPAISALARAIRRSRAGLKNPHRPVGSFLFLGPTGVGKTEVARCLAEFLFGSNRSMIRFDMSEFMEKHAVSKLIGSPPGYVGHEEGGQLTERVKRSPYSVLLFDEIEKAHPDLFNILLQVFEDGILTDGLGNTVDFKNTIIIMTSNIGARFIQKKGTMGFQGSSDVSRTKMEEMVMNAVRQTFNPEFINRLDEIIVFDELGDEELLDVLQLQVDQINATMSNHGFIVRLADDAKQWIINKTCADRSYGARPLRRALQKYVEDPLSEALIQGQLADASLVEMFVDGVSLNFRSISIDDEGHERINDLVLTQ
ncbi:MAG TPA: ATP-dependent Clp protease ATP-binding subunit [Pyrinomonadaceae bacterium]|jgi:ATP-dependent Clp protease ATP-binding subunit ClpC|nr:ATP-dependent Clp protease ATP-binding subunit [Pyrinomonadaceae bacterium]